jgi:hypothetical protein
LYVKQQYGGPAKSAFNLSFDDDYETTGVRHGAFCGVHKPFVMS